MRLNEFLIHLSNEEKQIVRRLWDGKVDKSSMNERQQEVARGLVIKGAIHRVQIGERTFFKPKWRV